MKNQIQYILIVLMVMISCFTMAQGSGNEPKPPQIIKPIDLRGPRVGITYISPGKTANRLIAAGYDPVFTQFGWQFERRYWEVSNGFSGLIELVLLAGGLEQGTLLPSASFLVGIRSGKGQEFGFGPNLTLNGPSFVFAFGTNFTSGDINFPVNIALVPDNNALRFSLLAGFNARTH